MEKLWLHIWIKREKLRYKHNKPFMCQNLVALCYFSLFNSAVSPSESVVRSERMSVNDEFHVTCKEIPVISFNVLSQDLIG